MGGKNSTSTSQVQIPPEVLQRYNSVNARAEDTAQTPFQNYGGQFVAGLTGTQAAGIQNTNALAGAAQPSIQAGQQLSLASAADLQPDQYNDAAIGKFMSPYLSSVYNTTAANIDRQNQTQQQGMIGDQIKQNAFGGDRGGIQRAELMRSQNLAGQQTLSGILQQGFGQAQTEFNQQQQIGLGADQNTAARMAAAGQQIGALGVQGQQAGLAGAAAQMSAGQVEQGTQQADLTAQYNQFLQQKSYPFQVAQFLANIAMGTGALSGSTTTSTSPAPFFSDERLKENIHPVGKTFDGQTIHRYNYKGDDRTQIGLLAQDVAHKRPEAVGQDSGFLTVDYDKATRNAAGLGAAAHHQERGLAAGGSPGPYQQMGGQSPYPNPMSYVPQAILPVGSLATAKVDKSSSTSGGLGDAAKSAQSVMSLYKDGKSIYSDMTKAEGGEVDDNGDYPDAPMAGKPPDVHSFVPKADLPVAGLHPADAPKGGSGGSGLGDVASLMSSAAKFLPFIMAARGGAIDMDPDEMAARTLYREAGNESDDGIAGVAHVIQNRERAGGYGDGLAGVITKPKQFSPWNTAGTGSREDPLTVDMQSPGAQRAQAIWQKVRSGEIPDPTNGALNFYNPRLASPKWGEGMQNRISIGNHDFGTAGAGRDASAAIARAAPQEGLGEARAYSGDDPRPMTVRGTPTRVAQAQGLGAANDAGPSPTMMQRAAKAMPGDDNNQKLSLLAGLFGMLSSKSHWLLPAIGEGGLAGIETYKGLQKQDADVEQTRAGAANTRMDAIGKSIQYINGKAYMIGPNGIPILLQNYEDNPVPLAGSRNSTDLVNAGGPSAKPGAAAPLTVPKLTPVERGPDLAPPAPAAGTAAPANPNQSPMKPPPPPANQQPPSQGATNPSRMSNETLAAADQEGTAFASADPAKHPAYAESLKRAEGLTNQAQAEREAAERVGPIVNELAKTIANTPKSGWMQSGAWADARAKIGRELNQVLGQMRLAPFADVNNITNKDIQEKLQQIQAGNNAQNAQQGHVAAYMIDQYKATVPNASMTPEAQAELMAQNFIQQQRTIDRHQALSEYRKRSGARNGSIPGTANDFETGFARDYDRKSYLEDQKAIQSGYADRTVNGKPKNAMQMILSGEVTDPAKIDRLLGRPGIHRYFIGSTAKLQGK